MSDLQVNPATLEFAKHDQARRRKHRARASVVGLLIVAGIASAGYWGWNKYQNARQAALIKQAAAAPETIRELERSGQLTDDQARDARRQAWEKREKDAMDGFFKTPAADRTKYMDGLLDEMQKDQARRMAEWQRDRPATRPTSRPDRPDRPTSRPSDAEIQQRMQQRADNQSPLQRAQQSEFRAAMRARAEARGIDMRRMFGGGRGGPGGGRGPGGGGGGGR